jgi:hypothetical protein
MKPNFSQLGQWSYLFFQGNNDRGKTWDLSKVEVGWAEGIPYLVEKS